MPHIIKHPVSSIFIYIRYWSLCPKKDRNFYTKYRGKVSFIKEDPQGIIFKIYLQPRSSKNMIEGLHGDALKIRVKAPPVDGAANKMCIQYLAKCLGISKSSLEIISGLSSRTKRVLLHFGDGKSSEAYRNQQKRLVESLLNS